jgi:hypothetical protein
VGATVDDTVAAAFELLLVRPKIFSFKLKLDVAAATAAEATPIVVEVAGPPALLLVSLLVLLLPRLLLPLLLSVATTVSDTLPMSLLAAVILASLPPVLSVPALLPMLATEGLLLLLLTLFVDANRDSMLPPKRLIPESALDAVLAA